MGNVIINGLSVVHKGSNGKVHAKSKNFTGPQKKVVEYDSTCKTDDLENTCNGFLINGHEVATIDSFFSKSTGDEAGDGGGIKSGTIGGKGEIISASPDTFVAPVGGVLLNGRPIARQGDMVISNGGNCEPAPIEQEGPNGRVNVSDLEFIEQPEEPTPYCVRHICYGPSPVYMQGVLGVYHADEIGDFNYGLPYEHEVSDKDDHRWNGKRLTFHNLPEDTYNFCYVSPTVTTDLIYVPVMGGNARTVDIEKERLKFEQEPNQTIYCHLTYKLSVYEKTLNPANNDYSDIFRLSDDTRAQVYDALIHHQLSARAGSFDGEEIDSKRNIEWGEEGVEAKTLNELDKSWYELMPAPLKKHIKDELKEKNAHTLPDGFVYVYLDGYLWREFEIKDGLSAEVDLHELATQDVREATGLPFEAIALPYKVAGIKPLLEIAYSEEQWSWARVNYFGGMNPEDFRTESHDKALRDVKAGCERRLQRFSKMDFSEIIDNFEPHVTDDLGNHCAYFKVNEGIDKGRYYVALDTPMLATSRATRDIQTLKNSLIALTEEMQNPLNSEHFGTASLCYHYFYNKQNGLLASQASTEAVKEAKSQKLREHNEHLAWNAPFTAEHMEFTEQDKLALALDLDAIKDSLKVDKRRRTRDLIRFLQRALVGLIEERKTVEPIIGDDLALLKEAKIPYLEAVRDDFSLEGHRYAIAFAKQAAILNSLSLNPAIIDQQFDLELEQDLDEATVGDGYIVSLLDKAHPLHAMLFPTDEDITEAENSQNFVVEREFEKQVQSQNKGDGRFYGVAFAYFNRLLDDDSFHIFGRPSFEGADLVVQAIIRNLVDSLHKEKYYQNKLVVEAVRVSKGYIACTRHPKASLFEWGVELKDSHTVVGLEGLGETRLSNKISPSTLAEFDQQMSQEVQDRVFYNNKEIASTAPSLETQARISFVEEKLGLEKFLSRSDSKRKKIIRSYLKKEVTPVATIQTEHYAEIEGILEKDKARVFRFDKSLTSIVLILSLWNIKTTVHKLREDKKNHHGSLKEDVAEFTSALTSTAYALENIARAYVGFDHVVDIYKKNSSIVDDFISFTERKGFLFTPLSTLGLASAVIDLSLGLKHLAYTLDSQDESLGVLQSINTGFKLGVTLSLFGDAANKALAKKVAAKVEQLALEKSMQGVSKSVLRKIALDDVMTRMGYGLARQSFIRFCLPLAETGVGVFLLLAGAMVEMLLAMGKDSELLSWAKSCHFSLDKKVCKKSLEDSEDSVEVAHCLDILIKPRVMLTNPRLDKYRGLNYELEVSLPYFDTAYQLELETEISELSLEKPTLVGSPFQPHLAKLVSRPFAKPDYKSKSVYFDKAQRLHKVIFYYQLPKSYFDRSEETDFRIEATVKIKIDRRHILPLKIDPPKPLGLASLRLMHKKQPKHGYHAQPMDINLKEFKS